jgi:hypothetical protein
LAANGVATVTRFLFSGRFTMLGLVQPILIGDRGVGRFCPAYTEGPFGTGALR